MATRSVVLMRNVMCIILAATIIHSEGLPSSPRQLNNVNTTHNSTSLQWSSPADNGNRSDVYYIVECKKCKNPNDTAPCDESSCDEQVKFVPSNNVTDSSVEVHGLSPYTRYIFTVTAMNGVSGESNKGDWKSVNLTIVSSDTIPSAPTELKTTTVSESTVSLSWILQQANTVLLGYQIFYYPQDEPTDLKTNFLPSTNTTIEEYLLTGLEPGTTYIVKVRAKGRSGFGSFSKKVKSSTGGFKIINKQENVILIAVLCVVVVILLVIISILLWKFLKSRNHHSNATTSNPSTTRNITLSNNNCSFTADEDAAPSVINSVEMKTGTNSSLDENEHNFNEVESSDDETCPYTSMHRHEEFEPPDNTYFF